MFKVMILAARKDGIDVSEFAEMFERLHIPEVDKLVADGHGAPMLSYRRNYVQHGHELGTVQSGELDFDVIIECVFAGRDDFEFTRDLGNRAPDLAAMIGKDLERYIDLSSMRYLVVETTSGGAGAAPEGACVPA